MTGLLVAILVLLVGLAALAVLLGQPLICFAMVPLIAVLAILAIDAHTAARETP